MRFTAEIYPPGETEAHARTTPDVHRVAAAVASKLREVGFDVQLGEHRFPGVPVSSPDDEIRDDVIQQLDITGDDRIGLDILDGGISVAGDARHEEPQRFWSTALRVVRAVEEVTGWELRDTDGLLEPAAQCNVAPDGTVQRPARLTTSELEAAATDVARAYSDISDLPRPPVDPSVPSIKALLSVGDRIASLGGDEISVEIDLAPGAVTLAEPRPASAGYSRVAGYVDELMTAAMDLREEVGDTQTGRPTMVRLRVSPVHGLFRRRSTVKVECLFDRLPLRGGDLDLHWESVVTEAFTREPEWQPPWVTPMRELFRRAGYRV